MSLNPKPTLYSLQKQLKQFEKHLESCRVTSAQVEPLFDQLSKMAQDFRSLARRHPFADGLVEEDLNYVTYLYGRIITLCQEQEVSSIGKGTRRLEKKVKSGNYQRTAEQVNKLHKQIHLFCETHRPCKKGRQTLARARHSIQNARRFLQKKSPNEGEKKFQVNIEDPEREELANNLFDIGALFYKGRETEARKLIFLLPKEIKELLFDHLKQVKRPEHGNLTATTQWIQALLASAFDVSLSNDGKGYFTESEMADFFAEMSELSVLDP